MDNILLNLRKEIETQLLPLIDNDYIFYGLPYYSNIGDVLIWEGTRQLLASCKHNCIGSYASGSKIRESISQDTIIIIIGGGFWGDVWRKSFEYALFNIKDKYDNRIIFLPNSISYKDKNLLKNDVGLFNNYKDLYICCRDSFSYDFAKTFFNNHVLLIPDMAFYIDPISLQKYQLPSVKGGLLLQRNDCEANTEIDLALKDMDVYDWPTMEGLNAHMFFFKSLFRIYYFLVGFELFDRKCFRNLVNVIGLHFFRKYMLKVGVQFISRYKTIVTTRLHPMILAFLLNKEVSFVDNSYGKISHLYTTWLKEAKIVSAFANLKQKNPVQPRPNENDVLLGFYD